jgi:hypothetical protein
MIIVQGTQLQWFREQSGVDQCTKGNLDCVSFPKSSEKPFEPFKRGY